MSNEIPGGKMLSKGLVSVLDPAGALLRTALPHNPFVQKYVDPLRAMGSSNVTAQKAPKTPAMPDFNYLQQQQQAAIDSMRLRSGRMSTILSQGSDQLGLGG